MSNAQLSRVMHTYVAHQARSVSAPVFCWAGLTETEDQFADRIEVIQSMHDGRILAVVPYGFACPDGCEPVVFIPKLFVSLHPQNPERNRCISGGRGSGKSHGVATAVILKAFDAKNRILCCREVMKSLRESVHHLLTEKIDALGLTEYFDVNDREITCTLTGSEIIFAGLFANLNSLKSLENIALVWGEESESISAQSIQIISPTIRARNSELWWSLNPDAEDAPIMKLMDGTRPDVAHTHVIFSDNSFFPEVLNAEREYMKRTDDDAYRHVWLGETRKHSEAQVFRGKYAIEDFTSKPEWSGPYFGGDWGYAVDPSCLVKAWIHERTLYIEYEAYAIGCDIDRTPALFDAVPDARKHTIRADSARPETISFMQRNGYPNMVSVKKWTGSVEDGIAHIRSYERIVIHPRCTHSIDEFRLYSFKVDRLSGDILPVAVDRHNHVIDALRYALAPMIQGGGQGILGWYASQVAGDTAKAAEPAKRPHFLNAALQIKNL